MFLRLVQSGRIDRAFGRSLTKFGVPWNGVTTGKLDQ